MREKLVNFGFTHKCGILMPVSSLPNKYGIGSFGKSSFDFIDFLAECKQRCWQVLPLNPTAYGDSPYQSPCSFAGSPYYIDLDILAKQKLLEKDELEANRVSGDRVDYGMLFRTRINVLRTAYSRFTSNARYVGFKRRNSDWLEDYALFMALKERFDYRAWSEWEDEYKFYAQAKTHAQELEKECDFWCFVQFEFFEQWLEVRKYAHKNGIDIIGDMPIYVAYDSVEVWRNPDQFMLDENLAPTIVAGCPPDAFAEKGQLWGNPIYNWERMREDGFSWWVARVKRNFELYDMLRIDHFRGFAGYYAIPYGEETAENGEWLVGVGKELFERINQTVPRARIIAEDLGLITDDVTELLEQTGYPGMKVLQFAFSDAQNEYLPRNYKNSNCIVYTSTHDSLTAKEWYDALDEETKKQFFKECPVRFGQTPTYALIRFALDSRANLAMVALQDYMEIGGEGRINTPATAIGNWTWRVSNRFATSALKRKILDVVEKTSRG